MPPAAPDFDYAAALGRCARGDGAALRSLYLQEGGRLLGVAQRIVRDMALAEDIVQDAFVNIWRRSATFESPAATRGAGSTASRATWP